MTLIFDPVKSVSLENDLVTVLKSYSKDSILKDLVSKCIRLCATNDAFLRNEIKKMLIKTIESNF